jgi:glucosyl-dolichyl phosphate glucuronosyltransferase
MMGGEEKDIYLRTIKVGGEIYYAPKPYVHHIIPIERATKTFIEKQAIGVGMSEKARVKGHGLELTKSWIRELAKWAVSLALAFFYFITFRPTKAGLLIQFRWWVTKGLLH